MPADKWDESLIGSVLMRAVMENNMDLLRLVVARMPAEGVSNAASRAALTVAVERGESHLVQILLEWVHPGAGQILILAIERGHASIVQLLLDTNKLQPTNNMFMIAVRMGYLAIVKILSQDPHIRPGLAHTIDQHKNRARPIDVAAYLGYRSIVQWFIETYPWMDPVPCLEWAERGNHSEVTDELWRDERVRCHFGPQFFVVLA